MVTSGVVENGSAKDLAGSAGAMMLPAMGTQRGGGGALAAFSDANPKPGSLAEAIQAAEKVGGWLANGLMFGVKTTAQGAVLYLTCSARGMDMMEFDAKYHITAGRVTKKATTLLAEMIAEGVEVDWLDIGETKEKASATFTARGKKPLTFTTTLQDAANAGWYDPKKKDSAWVCSTGSMLRADVVRKAARVVCPKLFLDVSDDMNDYEAAETTATKEAPAARKPLTPKDAAKVATAPVAPPVADPTIIETTIEKVEQPPFVTNEQAAAQAAATSTAPTPPAASFPTAADLAEMAEPDRIRAELKQVLQAQGVTVEQFVSLVNSRNPELKATTLAEVPDETITSATAKLRAKAAATSPPK